MSDTVGECPICHREVWGQYHTPCHDQPELRQYYLVHETDDICPGFECLAYEFSDKKEAERAFQKAVKQFEWLAKGYWSGL